MSYLLLFLNICFANPVHAPHVAEYYFQLEGKYLNLKFVIEKEDLMNFEFGDVCDFQNMTALCTVNYLNQHSSIKINGNKLAMELQSSFTEHDHLIVHLGSELNTNFIKEISIQNQCFYEFEPKFKNRIILDVAQFQKSYLLNRKRNKIILN